MKNVFQLKFKLGLTKALIGKLKSVQFFRVRKHLHILDLKGHHSYF